MIEITDKLRLAVLLGSTLVQPKGVEPKRLRELINQIIDNFCKQTGLAIDEAIDFYNQMTKDPVIVDYLHHYVALYGGSKVKRGTEQI